MSFGISISKKSCCENEFFTKREIRSSFSYLCLDDVTIKRENCNIRLSRLLFSAHALGRPYFLAASKKDIKELEFLRDLTRHPNAKNLKCSPKLLYVSNIYWFRIAKKVLDGLLFEVGMY